MPVPSYSPPIEVGLLTQGKPTLGMALVSLILQEECRPVIHLVDTGERPVINRDDIMFALRLANDRGISCEYEYVRDKRRAFSQGRLRLLETLGGPYVCFTDDDVVLPSTALARLLAEAGSTPCCGYVAPRCRNVGSIDGALEREVRFCPGTVFHQDDVVRTTLLEYYSSTVDVLDRQKSDRSMWEIAFLSELFPALGRRCSVQEDNVVFHVDYHERPDWRALESSLRHNSETKARDLASRFAVAPIG